MTLTTHPFRHYPRGIIAGPLGFYPQAVWYRAIGPCFDTKDEAEDCLARTEGIGLWPCPFAAAQAAMALMWGSSQ
jgi:hypothetical protein